MIACFQRRVIEQFTQYESIFWLKKIRYADIGIKKSLGGCIDDFNYHIQLSFLNFHSVNIL